MGETTALKKRSCAACGAQAEWNAGQRALVCPYCGTESPAELDPDSGEIREHPLIATLRQLPEELRGWKTQRHSVKCQSCQAVSVFEPSRVGQTCAFCGSPELVDYEEIKAPIKPESLLPFRVDRGRVQGIVKRWLSSRWWAPKALKRRSQVDTVVGVYLPYWTFDSKVHCRWTAMSGDYYYTTESYRDARGQLRTRRVRHTRWYPSRGSVRHSFDDVLIAGTRAVDAALRRKIETFPTRELVPYDTAYLSGWIVERYQVILLDAAKAAREKKDRFLRRLCARKVPGDTHRNLKISPDYSEQTFKHILVPVWILNYDYGRSRHQVLINGYDGRIAGRYPKSAWKIFFASLLVILLVALILFLFNQ